MNGIDRDLSNRAFFIAVFWRSPWDRLAGWLWSGPQVRDGSLRDRLACWADRRDRLWTMRYAMLGCDPPARWKRKAR